MAHPWRRWTIHTGRRGFYTADSQRIVDIIKQNIYSWLAFFLTLFAFACLAVFDHRIWLLILLAWVTGRGNDNDRVLANHVRYLMVYYTEPRKYLMLIGVPCGTTQLLAQCIQQTFYIIAIHLLQPISP